MRLCERVEVGDILLFRTPHAISNSVRLFTQSRWDHVAMIVRIPLNSTRMQNLCVFEATYTGGVQTYPLYTRLQSWATCPQKMKMSLRKIENWKPSQHDLHRLDQFVSKSSGKPYGITPVLQRRRASDHKTFFCSQLIASAYKAVGLLDISVSSSRILPAHFGAGHKDDYLRLLSDARIGPEISIDMSAENSTTKSEEESNNNLHNTSNNDNNEEGDEDDENNSNRSVSKRKNSSSESSNNSNNTNNITMNTNPLYSHSFAKNNFSFLEEEREDSFLMHSQTVNAQADSSHSFGRRKDTESSLFLGDFTRKDESPQRHSRAYVRARDDSYSISSSPSRLRSASISSPTFFSPLSSLISRTMRTQHTTLDLREDSVFPLPEPHMDVTQTQDYDTSLSSVHSKTDTREPPSPSQSFMIASQVPSPPITPSSGFRQDDFGVLRAPSPPGSPSFASTTPHSYNNIISHAREVPSPPTSPSMSYKHRVHSPPSRSYLSSIDGADDFCRRASVGSEFDNPFPRLGSRQESLEDLAARDA